MKEFPSQTFFGEVHPETAPLYRTEHCSRGERVKGAENRGGGRGAARKRGQKMEKEWTRENKLVMEVCMG